MKVTDITILRKVKPNRLVPTRRKPTDFLKPEKSEAPNTIRDGSGFRLENRRILESLCKK